MVFYEAARLECTPACKFCHTRESVLVGFCLSVVNEKVVVLDIHCQFCLSWDYAICLVATCKLGRGHRGDGGKKEARN